MTRSRWPVPPIDDAHLGPESTAQNVVTDCARGVFVATPAGPCKHSPANCETCGTHERRDVVHTTNGGRGVVGRIKR
jgi:hypothetical protein